MGTCSGEPISSRRQPRQVQSSDCRTAGMWGRRSLLVVTGASQGLGRCIAVELSRKVGAGSVALLMARSQPGLDETKSQVAEANAGVQVVCKAVDLEQPLQPALLKDMLTLCKDVESVDVFEVAILVHNAGSVGDVSELTAGMGDAAKWSSYLSLNVVSVSTLTSQFLALLGDAAADACRTHVVNVTSLCAVQAFPSLGYYCVGKAAREMFLRVLALERPHLRVLSYSPGAVATDMVAAIEGGAQDPGIRDMFRGLREDGKLLQPIQTTRRLLALLQRDQYTSGQRVDYFDLDDDANIKP